MHVLFAQQNGLSPYRWAVRVDGELKRCTRRVIEYTFAHNDLPPEMREIGPAHRLDLVVDDAVVDTIVDLVLEDTLWTQGTPDRPLGPFAAIDRSQRSFTPAMKSALGDAAIESAVASAVRAAFDGNSDLEETTYEEEDGIQVVPAWLARMKSVADGDPGIELSFDDLDPVSRGYAEAVVFFAGVGGDEDDWESISVFDFAPGALHRTVRDCYRFLLEASDLHPLGWRALLQDIDPEEFGHTFLLSRQGSGVSFADRDIDEGVAQRLDEISGVFGSLTFEVGDDGKVHISGASAG